MKIPVREIVAVDHDPGVYSRVPTKARMITKQRSGVIKLGAYHSQQGWSFWACGLGRNAVVIETSDRRYSTVVVEVENPVATVRAVREAAGLPVLGSTPARSGADGGTKQGAAGVKVGTRPAANGSTRASGSRTRSSRATSGRAAPGPSTSGSTTPGQPRRLRGLQGDKDKDKDKDKEGDKEGDAS